MKFKSLIILAIFSIFFISCGKDNPRWINPYDPAADQSEIEKLCKETESECGNIIVKFHGISLEINCGKCADGYDCSTENICKKNDNSAETDTDPSDTADSGEDGDASDTNDSGENDDASDTETADTDTSISDDDTDPTPDEDDPQPDADGDSTSDDDTDTANPEPDTPTIAGICTGQNKCYNNEAEITCPTSSDDFYGQDAQFTGGCTAQNFTATSKIVVDNNTGLTWEKSPSTDTYKWDNRATHCNELNSSNYGGINTWRVPNPLELLTIVNNSKYDPATNSNFTGMPTENNTYLWTNSEYKDNKSYAYVFSPSYGWYYGNADNAYSKTKPYKVLCVSGKEMKPAVSGDFTTSSDGKTVTDNRTGLIWQKDYLLDKPWQEAFAYCKTLNAHGYGGYSAGWHLPNKNELVSLVNYEKTGSPHSYFPDMPGGYFWSSSTYAGNKGNAWGVHFYYGNVYISYKTNNIGVRCVRSANYEPSEQDACTAAGGNWDNALGNCTKTVACSAKPDNTVWNGASSYTKTYADGTWSAGIATEYSLTEGACHYKCSDGHFYVQSSNLCEEAETKTSSCPAKPANSAWNNGNTFTQTCQGDDCQPATADVKATYSATPGVCTFVCNRHYLYNSSTSKCQEADYRTYFCEDEKLPNNAEWTSGSEEITQYALDLDGSSWATVIYTYSEDPDPNNEECRYKCKPDYQWGCGTTECELCD